MNMTDLEADYMLLKAENEQLKAEVAYWKHHQDISAKEYEKLQAQLERERKYVLFYEDLTDRYSAIVARMKQERAHG